MNRMSKGHVHGVKRGDSVRQAACIAALFAVAVSTPHQHDAPQIFVFLLVFLQHSQKEYPRMEMFRQGDVLITRIARLPEGLNERQGKIILAGEVTGHAHRLVQGRVLEGAHGALFLEVLQQTHVIHEEHRSLTLEPGSYQITRQREYAPEAIKDIED